MRAASTAPRLYGSSYESAGLRRQLPKCPDAGQDGLLAALLLGCSGAAAYLLWPGPHHLIMGAVSTGIFAIVQVAVPGCRLRLKNIICPHNWAIFIFCLQLVVLPLSIAYAGPAVGELPYLPSDRWMNLALLVSTIAFLAFIVAYTHTSKKRLNSQPPRYTQKKPAYLPPLWMVFVFGFVGILGIMFAFGGPANLLLYAESPSTYIRITGEQVGDSATITSAASIFFRPFLGTAFVLLFCRSLDSEILKKRQARWLSSCFLLVIIGLSFAVFGYNRGSFAVPLVAVAAIALTRAPRHRLSLTVIPGIVLLVLLLTATVYRVSGGTVDLQSSAASWRVSIDKVDPATMLQVYGNGPQFLGFLLEHSTWAKAPRMGRILLSSLLYPVPILGKPFRRDSGTVLYNGMLNRGDAIDQIVTLQGEAFLDFGWLGVAASCGIVGWLVAKLQMAFEQSSTSFEIYAIQFAAIWVTFLAIGSVEILSQIAIYFGWPIYLFFMVQSLRSRQQLQARAMDLHHPIRLVGTW